MEDLRKYIAADGVCVIPNGITHIPENALCGCRSLVGVIISDSVKEIRKGAFQYCENLKSITIPEGVTSIGNSAFWNCKSLKDIIIPDSVTNIEKWAFANCYSLEKITLPHGLTKISEGILFDCHRLKTVDIPKSITHIDDCAFWGCSGLTIQYEGTRKQWQRLLAPCSMRGSHNAKVLFSNPLEHKPSLDSLINNAAETKTQDNRQEEREIDLERSGEK